MHPRVSRPLFLSAVSLVIVLAGILGGGTMAWSAIEPYVRSRNWQKTDAYVASVRLHSTSNGGRAVVCKAIYTYIVSGQRYRGNRASLYTSADMIGNYHRSLCRSLDTALLANTSICFYDVSNPQSSVLSTKFRAFLFAFALALLTLVGGIGVLGITDAFTALQRHVTFDTHRVRADEVKWPSLPIVTCIYTLLLASLAVPVSIDAIMHGSTHSALNLFIGIILCLVAVFCIKIIVTSRYAGDLLISAPPAQLCTLCVPTAWNGVPDLLVRWMKDGRFIGTDFIGKPAPLRVIQVSNRSADRGVEITDIEFTLPMPPAELLENDVVRLRITGTIGERPYQGTFIIDLN